MKESTGAEFSASVDDKKIVIGQNKATTYGMDFSKITTDNGYIIKADNNNIYVYGKTTQGTLNGIYELLYKSIGLEIYTGDCYTYSYSKGNAVTVDCKEYIFNPSIDYIYDLNGETRPNVGTDTVYSDKYQKRMGLVTDYYVLGGNAHAESLFVTNTEYFTGTTSNGHMSLDEKTAKEAANWFYNEHIKNISSKNEFLFGLSDDINWFNDTEAGQKRTDQYVIFMNNVAKELSDIMKKDSPDRNISLVLVAYNNTIMAPSVDIISQDNIKISVMYAPVQANWYKSLTDSVNDNVVVRNSDNSKDLYKYDADAEFKKWKDKVASTGDIYLWSYHTFFTSYLTPLDCFKSMKDNYKLAYDIGVKGIYDNVQYDNATSTDWGRLKTYLRSKLAENPTMSDETYNTLISNFMKAYFGPAADLMNEALIGERDVLSTLYTNQATEADIWGANYGCGQSPVWYCSKGNYEKWGLTRKDEGSIFTGKSYTYSGKLKTDVYDKMTAALNAVGSAITNNQLTQAEGEKINNRIKLEMLSVRYVLMAVPSNNKLDSSNNDTWDGLASDCNTLGLTKYKEANPTENTLITADMLKEMAGL